jgi:hypothetical protein
MKELELLQQEENNIRYIKSYPILKKLKLSPLKIELLQLILSYQSNGQIFHMGYDRIAEILYSTQNTITKIISELNKENYIQTKNKSNFNGEKGGSKTYIKVNMDYIIELLTPKVNSNEVKTKSDNNIPQKKNNVLEEIKLTKQKQDDYSIKLENDEVVKLNENDYNLIMGDEELKDKVKRCNNQNHVEYTLKSYKYKNQIK